MGKLEIITCCMADQYSKTNKKCIAIIIVILEHVNQAIEQTMD